MAVRAASASCHKLLIAPSILAISSWSSVTLSAAASRSGIMPSIPNVHFNHPIAHAF
jgi:hypothetical protein